MLRIDKSIDPFSDTLLVQEGGERYYPTMRLPLERILQSQGFGSRSECRSLIRGGKVSIRELVPRDPAQVFETEGLTFSLHGESWLFRARVYAALHKPLGYECSRQSTHHPSVFELFPEPLVRRGLQSAGRLDWDTEGLLLFSDDGEFIHRLMAPKKKVPKTYRAWVEETVDDRFIRSLRDGVLMRGETGTFACQDCRAIDQNTVELTILEGKYHQVKRMIAAAGNHCAALRRISVGPLRLEDLKLGAGQWKYLEPEELEALGACRTGRFLRAKGTP